MTNTTENQTTEQADLERLATVAEEADVQPEVASPTEDEAGSITEDWAPVQPSPDAVLAVQYMIIQPSLGQAEKRLDIEYPPELVQSLSVSVAAIGEKYSVNPPDWVKKWYEELQLARMIAAVGVFTYTEYNKQKAANDDDAGQESET